MSNTYQGSLRASSFGAQRTTLNHSTDIVSEETKRFASYDGCDEKSAIAVRFAIVARSVAAQIDIAVEGYGRIGAFADRVTSVY